MMSHAWFAVLAMVPIAARALDVSAGAVEVTGGSNLGLAFSSMSASGGATGSADTTQYGGNVTALYDVIPNLGAGLAVGFSHEKTKSTVMTATGWSYLIGPAVGFVYPLQEKLSLSLRGDAGWRRSHSSLSGGGGLAGGGGGSSGFGFDLGAGVRYFLSRAFSVNAELAYTYQRATDNGPPDGAPPGIARITLTNSGLRLGAGLSVYFGN
jgi:opacity protein-like surface antigen